MSGQNMSPSSGMYYKRDGSIGYIEDGMPVTGSIAQDYVPVTPNDTTDLPDGETVGIYLGVSGTVVVDFANGNTRTIPGLTAGVRHDMAVKRVRATGTDAVEIMAVY